jgi:hypothetical protein
MVAVESPLGLGSVFADVLRFLGGSFRALARRIIAIADA